MTFQLLLPCNRLFRALQFVNYVINSATIGAKFFLLLYPQRARLLAGTGELIFMKFVPREAFFSLCCNCDFIPWDSIIFCLSSFAAFFVTATATASFCDAISEHWVTLFSRLDTKMTHFLWMRRERDGKCNCGDACCVLICFARCFSMKCALAGCFLCMLRLTAV